MPRAPTAVKEKEAQAAPPVEEKKNLVPASETATALAASLVGVDEEYDGAGVSERREDNVIPFLYIAQKGSPQVNKRDPAYIEGLEPGMIFDTSTGQFWRADEGHGPLLVAAFLDACEVEWGLRNTPEKGFKGRHPVDTELLKQVREVPRDQGTGVFRIINNGHQLVSTHMRYMILAESLRPVAISLSSSAMTPSRALNTMLREKKRRVKGELRTRPAFLTLLRMNTQWVQRGENDWFVPVFIDELSKKEGGAIVQHYIDEPAYLESYGEAALEARKLYDNVKAGVVRAADPVEEETDTGAGTASREDNSDLDPDADPRSGSPI